MNINRSSGFFFPVILVFLVVVTMPLHLFVLEALASMGYTRSEIEDSLGQAKYDDVFATYLLLGRKTTDVSSGKILMIYMKNCCV